MSSRNKPSKNEPNFSWCRRRGDESLTVMVHCSRLIHRTAGFVLYRGFQNRWPVRHSLLGDGGCRLSAASACRADLSRHSSKSDGGSLAKADGQSKKHFFCAKQT